MHSEEFKMDNNAYRITYIDHYLEVEFSSDEVCACREGPEGWNNNPEAGGENQSETVPMANRQEENAGPHTQVLYCLPSLIHLQSQSS